MVKKIGVGIILAGLSVGLIAGAVNRTQDKFTQIDERQPHAGQVEGEGPRSLREAGNRQNGGPSQPKAQAPGRASVANADRNESAGYRGGHKNQGSSDPNPTEESYAEVASWTNIEGTVWQADQESLSLILATGDHLIVEGRAWRYAIESGFSTVEGHRISLAGFYEEGEFKVGAIHDLSSSQSVTLRQASGQPLWSGGNGRGA